MRARRFGFWALAIVLTACAEPGFVPPFPIPTPTDGACTPVLSPPELEASHIAPPERGRYNTNPPTSGIHYGTTVDAGIYTDPIPDEIQLHNLEHGHVVVQWRDLSAEDLADVSAAVEGDLFMMVMAPRAAMPWKLAITAWTKIQVCSEIPPGVGRVIQSFVAAHRDNAPESVP